MYLQSLTITNLRCFKEAFVELRFPGRKEPASRGLNNVTLLLGDNGSGKTTVLKAISLAVLSPVRSSTGFVPSSLVRRTRSARADAATVSGSLLLHGHDRGLQAEAETQEAEVSTAIERVRGRERWESRQEDSGIWESLYDDRSPAFFLVGYGATRRVESTETFDSALRGKTRLLRYQRVAGLFEDHLSLTPLEAWLPELRSGDRFRLATRLLNRLLPKGDHRRARVTIDFFELDMREELWGIGLW